VRSTRLQRSKRNGRAQAIAGTLLEADEGVSQREAAWEAHNDVFCGRFRARAESCHEAAVRGGTIAVSGGCAKDDDGMVVAAAAAIG
jgi:hypothetical protein